MLQAVHGTNFHWPSLSRFTACPTSFSNSLSSFAKGFSFHFILKRTCHGTNKNCKKLFSSPCECVGMFINLIWHSVRPLRVLAPSLQLLAWFPKELVTKQICCCSGRGKAQTSQGSARNSVIETRMSSLRPHLNWRITARLSMPETENITKAC